MRKLVISLLLQFSLLCFPQKTQSLGINHPFYVLEKEINQMESADFTEMELTIPETDASLVDTYKVLLKTKKLFYTKRAKKDYVSLVTMYENNIKMALHHYPDEPYFRLLAIERHAHLLSELAKKRNHQTKQANELDLSILECMTYLADVKNIPRVYYTIYNIFDYINANNKTQYSTSIDEVMRFREYVQGNQTEADKKLELLLAYWYCICYDNGFKIGKDKAEDNYRKARVLLDSNQNYQKAIDLWRMIIRQACAAVIISMQNNEIQHKMQQAQQRPKGPVVATNVQTNNAELEKALKALESINIHDAMHYEYAINQLSRHKKALKGQTDLPNLEKLMKCYPHEQDAQILNLYYHYYFIRDYQEILKGITQYSNASADERLLFLKLICFNKLSASKKEMLPIAEALVRAAPNNERFAHIKLSIERRIE